MRCLSVVDADGADFSRGSACAQGIRAFWRAEGMFAVDGGRAYELAWFRRRNRRDKRLASAIAGPPRGQLSRAETPHRRILKQSHSAIASFISTPAAGSAHYTVLCSDWHTCCVRGGAST